MPAQKNVEKVAELTVLFKESPLVIVAEYRGLDVGEMHGMRSAIRASESRFRIAKNTLARIAADNAGRPGLKEIIDGPIGFLTTRADPAAAAKSFVKHIEGEKLDIKIIGGALEDEMLSSERVVALAKLPTREELIAKMLGAMNGPISGLVMVMSGPVRALATVLQRISEKQGPGEERAEPEPAGA